MRSVLHSARSPRRVALALLLILCGLSPAQQQVVLYDNQSNAEQAITGLAPTLWLDSSYPGSIWDSATAVELWKDRRADNRENLLLQSGNLSASWSTASATIDDATHFTPTAQGGAVYQNVATVAGVSYTLTVKARAVSGNTSLWLFHSSSATADYTPITVTATLAEYSVTVLGKTGSGNVAFGMQDRNAAGFGQVEVTQMSVRSPNADPRYHLTTTAAKLAGDGYPRFVQTTAASKPATTLGTNLENRFVQSSNFGTTWTGDGATFTADTAATTDPIGTNTADILVTVAGSSAHGMYQTQSLIAGETYRQSIYVKQVTNRQYFVLAWYNTSSGKGRRHYFDITNGVVGASQAIGAGITSVGYSIAAVTGATGWYRITSSVTADTSATFNVEPATASADNTWGWDAGAGGSSEFYVWGGQVQSSLADPTYIATTTYPLYRGVSGRRGVRFDGAASKMASTSALSSVIGAAAATVFIVERPNLINSAQVVFADQTNAKMYVFMTPTNGGMQWVNDDGAADLSTVSGQVVGAPYVMAWQHDSGKVYSWINGAAGSSANSGNTSDLTGTIGIGSYGATQYYNGTIAELLTFNKVLSAPDRDMIQKYLCRKWGANC